MPPALTEEEGALPRPVDDGACGHLIGLVVPDLVLPAAPAGEVSLRELTRDTAVIFVYPATGTAAGDPAPGWDEIPGAVGCTAQSIGYTDAFVALSERNVRVLGISAQTPEEQAEFHLRRSIPFQLASDQERRFADALGLPTFAAGPRTLLRRVTLVIEANRIAHVRYPVFPPRLDAEETLRWISARPHG